jgi:hypothetical protein
MQKLKFLTASIVLASSAIISAPATAAEYYTRVTVPGPTPIDLINPQNEGTLPVGKDRVVHALIITNTDSTPVQVTLSKSQETGSTQSIVTKNVSIVHPNSTITIPFSSGLYLHKTSATVYDDLLVELNTTSKKPVVDLTVDYEDD